MNPSMTTWPSRTSSATTCFPRRRPPAIINSAFVRADVLRGGTLSHEFGHVLMDGYHVKPPVGMNIYTQSEKGTELMCAKGGVGGMKRLANPNGTENYILYDAPDAKGGIRDVRWNSVKRVRAEKSSEHPDDEEQKQLTVQFHSMLLP